MVRHIILWQFKDEVKAEGKQDEAFELIRQSTETMNGKIDGLLSAEIGVNTMGGDYDFVYCADFTTQQALAAYQTHPLHEAHKARTAPYLKGRLVVDYQR